MGRSVWIISDETSINRLTRPRIQTLRGMEWRAIRTQWRIRRSLSGLGRKLHKSETSPFRQMAVGALFQSVFRQGVRHKGVGVAVSHVVLVLQHGDQFHVLGRVAGT